MLVPDTGPTDLYAGKVFLYSGSDGKVLRDAMLHSHPRKALLFSRPIPPSLRLLHYNKVPQQCHNNTLYAWLLY